MKPHPLLSLTVENALQLPHPFPFCFSAAFFTPPPHALCCLWYLEGSLCNKAGQSEAGLELDPNRGHSHFARSPQTWNVHWVLLCVHYSLPQGDIHRLNCKNNLISPQNTHHSEQSDQKPTQGISSWEWHPVAHKKGSDASGFPVPQQIGQGKLCPIYQPWVIC